ncbi:MAG TPA: hemolysin family protein, partial [Acidimicrobiales bacterium]|nr:hemolysin family protein [Acidimicrobiales bacterium]
VLIVLSGLLALAETGLTRTSRHRAMALQEEGKRGAGKLLKLVEHPQKFLNPVLLIVLICQLVSATLVGVVAGHLFGPWGIAVATAFEILVIFVFAEAVPKNWAVRKPDRAALAAAPFVSALVSIPPVQWISTILIKISNVLVSSDGSLPRSYVTEGELLALADVAMEEEAIESQEREMIHSIFEFGDSVVREVMTPRPDMLAVEAEASVGDVIKVAIAAGYSRIPVYSNGIDDIAGVVYIKDLILADWQGKKDLPVREVAREANFVPETKKLASLMRQMQAEKFHMAIVVDEYGGTSGLVTIEDLIEEVFGEITDEFDVEERSFETLPNGDYRVNARMPIDELNERLDANLPEGDWDTVGGLMAGKLDHIPAEGESIELDKYRLVAERVKGNRIGRVRISPIDPDDHEEGHGGGPVDPKDSKTSGSADSGARGSKDVKQTNQGKEPRDPKQSDSRAFTR